MDFLSHGFALFVVLSVVIFSRGLATLARTHPLDPLSCDEHLLVRNVLINASLLCPADYCSIISTLEVDEPDKSVVKGWMQGNELPPRKALVLSRQFKITRKIIVNLDKQEVESNEVHEGAGGLTLTSYEFQVVKSILNNYEPFLESLAKRGLSISETESLALSPGWYNVAEDVGKRLVNMASFYLNGTANFYLRPVSGIIATIDLDDKRVIRYRDDYKGVPLPKKEGTDYRLEAQQLPLRTPLKAISIEQPDGPSFTIDGHSVQWGNYWRFHVKMDNRAGTVISMAEVYDGEDSGVWRSVLYKGFVSEMFVPYQDPDEEWFYRTYMDAGEYGLGASSLSLQPFNDCPRHAHYMDAILPTASGVPVIIPDAICIFERYAGDVAWRHSETLAKDENPVTEVRPKVTLVVRMVATVGNYDYVLDWEFQTDGLIRVVVGLTGIVMVKSTEMTYVKNDLGIGGDRLHGSLVSENTVAVIHDHFLTYHLDLDVDGSKNSFVESKMKRQKIPPGSGVPRKSYWYTEKHVAQTEGDARIQLSLLQPSEFFVINSEKRTRLGNPTGYRLVPSATAAPLLDPDDFPEVRAAFVNNQIWVTQYHKEEKWAGGQYPVQSHGDDTLAVWSSKNRKIANEDIVLWYTLGFHHVPVQEDFPIMPTVAGSFELKPANFFEQNPILKSRPNTAEDFATYFADKDISIGI